MTDAALVVPLEVETPLVSEATRHGHRIVFRAATGDDLAGRLRDPLPAVVVAAAAPPFLSRRLIDACDRLGVRLLVLAASEAERRHAAALGILDMFEGAPRWAALLPIGGAVGVAVALPRPATPSPASPAPVGLPPAGLPPVGVPPVGVPPVEGRLVAVWGPVGAPGRTGIAIGLASELARRGGGVVLVDADTHGAAIAPALGLADESPGFAAACRLAAGGALDPAQLDRLAQRHRRSDVRVLTGIGRPSRWPELGAARVEGVLAALRRWARVTVVDTAASLEEDEEVSSDLVGPRRNAATLTALRAADHVVAVAAGDPIGLSRYLRMHGELLDLVGADRVTVVVNKVRASAVGVGAAGQVLSTLERFGGIRDPVLVPWDLAAFDAAVLSGVAVGEAAPRSAATAAIRELADRVG